MPKKSEDFLFLPTKILKFADHLTSINSITLRNMTSYVKVYGSFEKDI